MSDAYRLKRRYGFQALSGCETACIGVSAIGALAELDWLFGRYAEYFCVWRNNLATPGGFEPPISTVTGWHVCPLHHGAILVDQATGNGSWVYSQLECIKDWLACQGRRRLVSLLALFTF